MVSTRYKKATKDQFTHEWCEGYVPTEVTYKKPANPDFGQYFSILETCTFFSFG